MFKPVSRAIGAWVPGWAKSEMFVELLSCRLLGSVENDYIVHHKSFSIYSDQIYAVTIPIVLCA